MDEIIFRKEKYLELTQNVRSRHREGKVNDVFKTRNEKSWHASSTTEIRRQVCEKYIFFLNVSGVLCFSLYSLDNP